MTKNTKHKHKKPQTYKYRKTQHAKTQAHKIIYNTATQNTTKCFSEPHNTSPVIFCTIKWYQTSKKPSKKNIQYLQWIQPCYILHIEMRRQRMGVFLFNDKMSDALISLDLSLYRKVKTSTIISISSPFCIFGICCFVSFQSLTAKLWELSGVISCQPATIKGRKRAIWLSHTMSSIAVANMAGLNL